MPMPRECKEPTKHHSSHSKLPPALTKTFLRHCRNLPANKTMCKTSAMFSRIL
jgi:hypothetical protein